jgi:phosphoribosylanthranilate isomerase
MSETRTRIKICGITNLEDALAAVEYGADALGFILVRESPRFIGNYPDAWQIPYSLPPFISRVAVLRDAVGLLELAFLPDGYWTRWCDTVQFYQGESAVLLRLHKRAIRCFRIRGAESLNDIENHLANIDAILLDAYHPDKLGGAGETFDWELARQARERFRKPTILAGGLTPENVEDAVARVRPYAVDVSSGVEAEPGRKDHSKLRAFIRAVQKADRASGVRR